MIREYQKYLLSGEVKVQIILSVLLADWQLSSMSTWFWKFCLHVLWTFFILALQEEQVLVLAWFSTLHFGQTFTIFPIIQFWLLSLSDELIVESGKLLLYLSDWLTKKTQGYLIYRICLRLIILVKSLIQASYLN
jgi:hypothetical protein